MMPIGAKPLFLIEGWRQESRPSRERPTGVQRCVSMFILHIALQGCLKPGLIDYGVTADTGGHLRYLIDLLAATKSRHGAHAVATRGFHDADLGARYGRTRETLMPGVPLIRLFDSDPRYLPKEDLWRHHEALATALCAQVGAMNLKPTLLHGHYADGGAVARLASKRLGIPYLFTAHSLGAVKAQAIDLTKDQEGDGAAIPEELTRRIGIERDVIADAAAIVASSGDEAERQYALYPEARPERIHVIPPGCDLSAFADTDEADIPASVERFLNDPGKTPILALARPVRKKNLEGLVRAFGENADLRRRANLIIFAGNREDIHDQEAENQEVLSEILYLIDRYDLYGSIALPKHHDPAAVPAIYAYAKARGGVFVNAALNEPFGLTFLEAAAAGLPVVATNQGGPNDILERCRNGILVDPFDGEGISGACLDLIEDRKLWHACSREGQARSAYYEWGRHVREYLALARTLTVRPAEPAVLTKPKRVLLTSDIDNTLVGDEASLARFKTWRDREDDVAFAIATGRSLHSAISILRQWNAPEPDVLITSVGSEIYYRRGDGYEVVPDEEWEAALRPAWHVEAIRELCARYPSLVPQPDGEQRDFKLSFFAHPDDPARHALALDLRRRRLPANLIYSHGLYFDILPPSASKGHALNHIAQRIGISLELTVAAGDSGNDIEMLEQAGRSIVVGNHDKEIGHLRRLPHIYFAKATHAGGIVEGMERLDV